MFCHVIFWWFLCVYVYYVRAWVLAWKYLPYKYLLLCSMSLFSRIARKSPCQILEISSLIFILSKAFTLGRQFRTMGKVMKVRTVPGLLFFGGVSDTYFPISKLPVEPLGFITYAFKYWLFLIYKRFGNKHSHLWNLHTPVCNLLFLLLKVRVENSEWTVNLLMTDICFMSADNTVVFVDGR